MKFQNLEHTADLKIQAWGQTQKEVFTNMALGMFANIISEKDILKDQPVERKINVQSADKQSLLVDFLSHLVTLSDINDEVYLNYQLRILNSEIKGNVHGYKIKGLKLEIKAVTYNDLILEEKEGQWVAEVVFDI